jgi:hypothetical protein
MSAETFSSETAVQYLQQVAERPASVDSLTLLAGTVALTVREQLGNTEGACGLALAYLRASARHLPGISPAGNAEVEINGASKVGEILDVSRAYVCARVKLAVHSFAISHSVTPGFTFVMPSSRRLDGVC